MNNFRYIARDRSGSISRGTRTADSPESLRSLLETTGLSLVSFATSHAQAATLAGQHSAWLAWLTGRSSVDQSLSLLLAHWFRPSGRSVEMALKQLAMMLRSGLDLRSALGSVLEQTTSFSLKVSLRSTIEAVEQGRSLQSAMAQTHVFPAIAVQLVGVGEATGNLCQVLERAESHMAQRRQSLSTVRMALAYPVIVATAALSIAVYLIFSVIPEIQKMLAAMGRKLPRMTQSLVDLAQWVHMHGVMVAIIAACVVGGLITLTQWPPGRAWLDRALLRVPLIGNILRLSGTATLASSLAVMIRSGMKLVDSLTIAERLQTNRQLAMHVRAGRDHVVRGENLSTALVQQPGYIPMLSSMLEVAQRTGQLETTLEEVATFCESELQNRVKRLSQLAEPAIIIVAGLIVGYVYMAFFMALMSAGGNIR